FENLQKAFVAFANKVPFYGHVVVCGDEVRHRELFQNFSKPISFYGFDEGNDYVLKGSQGNYELFENDLELKKMKKLGHLKLSIPGTHNALNATAAVIIGLKAGFSFEVIQKGLERFQGVDRRFHFKGEKAGIKIYDDYGHHPTEVRATLQAFREKFPHQRLVVFCQPHRYSRTESCWHDFTQSFQDADQVLLTDIYPAGESPIEGIHSQRLAAEIKHSQVHYLPKESDLLSSVSSKLKAGDVFITLGAGDGWKLGMTLLESLK
ncbi:MAG: UDP-N-acetylmuramate--L-alanine ligase, partial [Pseudobdellovibrionaceae bacterium]